MDVEADADAVRLRELLESTGLKQHVTAPTHISGHTLDLIITRLSDKLDICSPWTVYLFSDHMPVYSKLQVCKLALKRSDITFRKIRSINKKLLRNEISDTDLCKNLLSYNLDSLVNAYNNTFKSVLDHCAPAITKIVVKRPTVPWFNDGVKPAKKEKRRAEKKCKQGKARQGTRLHSDLLDFKAKKNLATYVIKRARSDYYTNFIQANCSDSRKLFWSAKTLFDQEVDLNFTGYHDDTKLANDIGKFFVQKMERIRTKLDTAATTDSSPSFEPPHSNSAQLVSFKILSQRDVKSLIGKSSKKTCHLDPMPTPLVVECLDAPLPVIFRMINLSLQCGTFPDDWKLADVKPRLKKTGAQALFSNLRPISNLSFASKLTERAVFAQTHDYLITNKLYPKAQSAYCEFHSTETALLRVKNDILLNMN